MLQKHTSTPKDYQNIWLLRVWRRAKCDKIFAADSSSFGYTLSLHWWIWFWLSLGRKVREVV